MFFWAVDQVVVMTVDESSGSLVNETLLEALHVVMRGGRQMQQHDTSLSDLKSIPRPTYLCCGPPPVEAVPSRAS